MRTDDDALSTPQHLLHWARVAPHTVAVIESDRTYSYGDLAHCVVQYAATLRVSGVGPGMLVGLLCGHRYLHLALILACDVIGATSVSLSGVDVDDNDEIIGRCDFLCLYGSAPDRIGSAGLLRLTQDVIDRIAQTTVTADALGVLDTRRGDDDVVRLVRTSGSTGRAKVMPLTGANLRRMIRRTQALGDTLGYHRHFLNLYGFTLRSAFIECAIALHAGCTIVSSHLETVFQDLDRFPSTRMTLVPRDAARMLDARPPDWTGPRRCKLYVSGGTMPAEVFRRLTQEIVTDLHFVYGTIETHWLTRLDGNGNGDIMDDVEIRIVDDAGNPLPQGSTGLIEARTPLMVDGYLWNPTATAAAFTDGWYRTNDVGIMPAPGNLIVRGRADNMLNIGGVKVPPEPLEARIRSLDGVRDVVLLAEPGTLGVNGLTVVLEPEPTGLARTVGDGLAAILAPVAQSFRVRVEPSLPRTLTGKVRRDAIRA